MRLEKYDSFPISSHTISIPFTYPFKLPSIVIVKLNGSRRCEDRRWGGVKGGVTSRTSPPQIAPSIGYPTNIRWIKWMVRWI